jgi:hypothetical protein
MSPQISNASLPDAMSQPVWPGVWPGCGYASEVQFARPDAAPAQVACDRFGCQPVKKGCSVRTSIFKEETQQTVVCN